MRPREAHEEISVESVRRALLALHQETSDSSDDEGIDDGNRSSTDSCESQADTLPDEPKSSAAFDVPGEWWISET